MDERVRMSPADEGPTAARTAHDASDDTIEIEIMDEEALIPVTAPQTKYPLGDSVLGVSDYQTKRTARIDFVCNVTLGVLALGIGLAFLWPASAHRSTLPGGVTSVPAAQISAPALETIEPHSLPLPVRIANAFDATEVFEFPRGTTDAAARNAVAELLLNRARERHAERLAARHAHNFQAVREPAPEVFVTRMLEGSKSPLSGTN
jgi:hypothetical protein